MSRFGLGFISAGAPAGVTMVAGTDGNYTGFSSDAAISGTTFGSLSDQPLVGEDMVFLASDAGGSLLGFSGDVVSALSGKSLVVDGSSSYLLSSADTPPTTGLVPGYTFATWSTPNGPVFSNGVSYNIRIE